MTTCKTCNGKGSVKCPTCKGQGRIIPILGSTYTVKIVKALEWSNVECAKEKALFSKNMMGISVNSGLVLITF